MSPDVRRLRAPGTNTSLRCAAHALTRVVAIVGYTRAAIAAGVLVAPPLIPRSRTFLVVCSPSLVSRLGRAADGDSGVGQELCKGLAAIRRAAGCSMSDG